MVVIFPRVLPGNLVHSMREGATYGSIATAGDPVTPGRPQFQSLCVITALVVYHCSFRSGLNSDRNAG
ncbi:MAG TPA: hypothetical protein VH640_05795 [Bryobacteraceae bacterium]